MAKLNVSIAAPCSMSWNDMLGDERVRHCGGCEQNVYNLSDMTQREAEIFLQENGASKCLQFYRRADGTILTDNCPVGLRALRNKVKAVGKVVAAVVASVVAVVPFGKAFGDDAPQHLRGKVKVIPAEIPPAELKDGSQPLPQSPIYRGEAVAVPTITKTKQVMLGNEGCANDDSLKSSPKVMLGGKPVAPSLMGGLVVSPDALSQLSTSNKAKANAAALNLYTAAKKNAAQGKTMVALTQMKSALDACHMQQNRDPVFVKLIESEINQLQATVKGQ